MQQQIHGTLQSNASKAANIANILKFGNMPVIYKVSENKYIYPELANYRFDTILYIALAIIAIGLVIYVVRYKRLGLLGAISYIGFMALFSLVIRYTNVAISLEGIAGMVSIALINYCFMNQLVKNRKEEKSIEKEIIHKKMWRVYQELLYRVVPVIISFIVFSFTKWAPISSLGMIMFWGILLMFVYNIIITNPLLKEEKEIGGDRNHD